MTMATTLRDYLDREEVSYDLVEHAYTRTADDSARAAHIPGDQVAKSVLLEDEDGYVMAIIPATHRVEIGKLHKQLNRNLGLATERELDLLFDDCECGAIPAVGQAYGVDVVVDESIEENRDVYFEGGDHVGLVHVSGRDFERLMSDVPHGHFSHHI